MPRKYSLWPTLWTVGLLMVIVLTACDLNFNADDNPVSSGNEVYELLRWRSPDEAIDVVFAPDEDYGDLTNDTNRQDFLDDIADLIDSGFWQNNGLASNIAAVNFWFMIDTGDVAEGEGICPDVTWPDLTNANFAEVIVLVHPNSLRDCRWGNKVTTEPFSYRTVVHEFSHAAFNLPDEYCCDGGYWNVSPVMYGSNSACTSDAANSAWRDCQQLSSGSDTVNRWRSEGANGDIMRNSGSTVWEYGPADWVVVENVLNGLAGLSVQTPEVFAPDNWDWP